MQTKTTRILIAGAAGRDFHDFNVLFRHKNTVQVVGFTAAQIPNISDRVYPPSLAGPFYPEGIPIFPEEQIEKLIPELNIDEVIFAYSDVSHEQVMHLGSRVLAAGADFRLITPQRTMLKATKPVIAICAVRTGCGKSQTAHYLVQQLRLMGYEQIVAVRHPMPYGNLALQAVQRFATYADLDKHECTIEEREEYEPYIEQGNIVYAGVDYEAILHQAAAEADIIIWDGGNNDLPFFRPDLHLVLVDPHRLGHESRYHPGETNLRLADAVLINKVDTAPAAAIAQLRRHVAEINPTATILESASPIAVADPGAIEGSRVLVVEDGPTLTHGGMGYGAGVLAAQRYGAKELIDPRPYAAGSLQETFRQYPETGTLLPAMGYGATQIAELETTINRSGADLVLIATPIDLGRLINIQLPSQRVRYSLAPRGDPDLTGWLKDNLGQQPVFPAAA